MATKTSSKSEKDRYSRYKSAGTYAKNKRKKIERHLKKYPSDTSAKQALKAVGSYGRKTPNNNKTWSKQNKAYAELLAKVRKGSKPTTARA